MAERPDPGKPEVPQLRRFRMDPDGSGRAHEVEPTQQLPAPGPGGASYDDPAYDDPDALLRETDADLGRGWQPTDAPPAGAGAAADQTRRLPDSLEPRRPEPPMTAQSAGWDQPPGGPPTGPVGEDPDGGKKRNLVPIVIAAIAALAIIGLLLWFFVFSPSGESNDKAPTSETTQTTQTSEQSEQSSEGTQSEGDDSEDPGRDEDDGVRESGGGIAPTMPDDDNDDSGDNNDDAPQSDSNDDGPSKSGQPTMPGGTDRN